MSLLIMGHSDLFTYLGGMCGRPHQFLVAVVAERGGKGGFKVLVAAEAFEGNALACPLFLVVDIVRYYHHDLFYLVLNEHKGPFDFLLIRLLSHAFADHLNPLSEALLLAIEGICCHFFL